ncbi:hypothetical protein [Candidatus Aalborgicola defluviihabitans]
MVYRSTPPSSKWVEAVAQGMGATMLDDAGAVSGRLVGAARLRC